MAAGSPVTEAEPERRDERRPRRCCPRRARRPAARALLTVLAALTACNEVPQHPAERTLDQTFTLTDELVLAIDSAVSVAVVGAERRDDILAHLEITVTASTSTRARILADSVMLVEERLEEERALILTLPPPTEAGIGGFLELTIPADLDLSIIERGGTTEVDGVTGDLAIESVSHVRVTGAEQDVSIETSAGNVLLETALSQGSTTQVTLAVGDIELTVPNTPSVDLQALARSRGGVFPAHPAFPPFFGGPGDIYTAFVGGGLSLAQLVTGGGNIVIRGP